MGDLLVMRLFLAMLLIALPAAAQSVTTVEVYGNTPAIQAYNGLGTNITSTNSWEYTAAQSAHMKWGRFDCGWTGVELTKGTYSFPSGCASGLSNGGTTGVHSVMDALFGPPWTTIATGTITSTVTSGASTVAITVATGSLAGVVPGQTELLISPQWSSKASYSGALITGIAGTTLTMAATASSGFSAGKAVQVNLLFYPPVFIPHGLGYKTYEANTSIQAFAGYAHYLATQLAATGQTGQVSIWNEPPWGPDPWDQAGNLYTTAPSNGYIEGGNPGLGVELPLYIANLGTAAAGVTYDNGYPEVVGLNGDLFYTNLVPYQEDLFHLKSVFGTESFHPYGNNPEDAFWLGNACIYANLSNLTNLLNNCTPTGGVTGSAEKLAVAESFYANTFGGVQHDITETGFCRCNSPTPTETQLSRWNLRHFIGWQVLNITPVMFYRLAGDTNWEWLHSDHSAYPVYTAFKNLMTDISGIANNPVAAYSACMMPRVSSYTGYYPLATGTFVGATPGNLANSLLYYSWQRTYGSSPNWESVTSPASVNVSVVIPTGMTVSFVKDLVTGSSVSFTFTSQTLVYGVIDDPVEVMVVPNTPTTAPVFACT